MKTKIMIRLRAMSFSFVKSILGLESTAATRNVTTLTNPAPNPDFTSVDCTSCADPCESHAGLPDFLRKKIDMESPLQGSMKPYYQHILVQSGTARLWPEHVDSIEGSFLSRTSALLAQFDTVKNASNTMDPKFRSLLSAFEMGALNEQNRDESSPITPESTDADVTTTGDESTDILMFPLGIRLEKIRFSDLEEIMNVFKESSQEDDTLSKVLKAKAKPISHDATVLVCSHKKRDKRCGIAGPQLVEEFLKQIGARNLNVQVHHVSHFGGHKFAGNVIVYHKDSHGNIVGDWYGRVKPCHVQTILEETVEKGLVIEELWRGRMNTAFTPSKCEKLAW